MANTYITTDQGGFPTGGTAGQVPVKQSGTDFDYAWGAAGGGTGTSLEITVNQTGHGLVVGDWIRSNGTANQFTKAQADTAANAEVVGVVTTYVGINDFKYTANGIATAGVPAGTPNTVFFLDPTTPGAVTFTPPTGVGQIRKPLGIVIASGTKMQLKDFDGEVLTGGSTIIGNKIYVNSTDYTFPNSTAEETILSVTIPGNTLGTNNCLRVRLNVREWNMDNGGSGFTLKAYYGGNNIASNGFSPVSTSAANGTGVIEFLLYGDTATNAQMGTLTTDITVGDGSSTGGPRTNHVYQKGTSAIDSTLDQTLAVTGQFGFSASLPFVISGMTIENLGNNAAVTLTDFDYGTPVGASVSTNTAGSPANDNTNIVTITTTVAKRFQISLVGGINLSGSAQVITFGGQINVDSGAQIIDIVSGSYQSNLLNVNYHPCSGTVFTNLLSPGTHTFRLRATCSSLDGSATFTFGGGLYVIGLT